MSTQEDSQGHLFHGMHVRPPSEFELVETMLSLRAPVQEELRDPRLVQGILNKSQSVQPNLIVHRRAASKDASVEELAGEAFAELVRSMVKLENVEKSTFVFQDEAEGVLIFFELAPTPSSRLAQFHVFRLDDGMLTTLTMTVDSHCLTEERKNRYLQSLSTLVPKNT